LKRTGLWLVITVFTTVITLWACFAWLHAQSAAEPDGAVNIKVQMPGVRDHANLVRNPNGTFSYIVMGFEGERIILTPGDFAARLYEGQRSRTWLAVIFNVSSPLGMIWVGLGLLGQVLFTGRMVVQWLVSEKSRRSVVPPMFWWMSLLGAMMLLAYFLWRCDVVGILGQGAGLAIYLRNLQWIYFSKGSRTALDRAHESDAAEPVAAVAPR
jgi:lipid-A-disaccharide synthase-like uncharacterized protein